MYIIRLKCVSECLGIRRSSLAYLKLQDGEYSFLDLGHPISKFEKITIKGGIAQVLNTQEELVVGDEIYFYKNKNVESLGKIVTERSTLGLLLIPLNEGMINTYKEAINDGYTFDQWHGEFEYLIALIYEYLLNDIPNANEYYEKASDKGFNYKLLNK